MTHYTKGYAFERRVSALLRERGWITTEARGSHGAWDIKATRKHVVVDPWNWDGDTTADVLLIQCKTGAGKCSPAERAALDAAAKQGGAQWYLANSPKHGEIAFWWYHEPIDSCKALGAASRWVRTDTDALLGERSGDDDLKGHD